MNLFMISELKEALKVLSYYPLVQSGLPLNQKGITAIPNAIVYDSSRLVNVKEYMILQYLIIIRQSKKSVISAG